MPWAPSVWGHHKSSREFLNKFKSRNNWKLNKCYENKEINFPPPLPLLMMIFHLWGNEERHRGVGECEWMEIVYNNNSSGNSDDIRIQNVYCLLIFTLAWRFYIRLQNQIWWLRFNLLCHSFLQQQSRQCVDRVIVVGVIWKKSWLKEMKMKL